MRTKSKAHVAVTSLTWFPCPYWATVDANSLQRRASRLFLLPIDGSSGMRLEVGWPARRAGFYSRHNAIAESALMPGVVSCLSNWNQLESKLSNDLDWGSFYHDTLFIVLTSNKQLLIDSDCCFAVTAVPMNIRLLVSLPFFGRLRFHRRWGRWTPVRL